MFKFVQVISVIGSLLACAAGCQPAGPPTAQMPGEANPFLVTSEPTGAIPVGQARAEALDGQAVSVIGFIGGSKEPFVGGVAVFTVVDPKVPYCADDEGCPTPWDYCCHQDDVKSNVATVKFVDDQGKVINTDARQLLNVKPLNLVVLEGVAQRDEAGNLTLLTRQLFIKQ